MPNYRVRLAQQLAHEGRVYDAGAVVVLPRRIAAEIPHLVDEVDDSGKPLLVARDQWEIALEDVRQHERVSILQQERRAAAARLDDLRDAGAHASAIASRASATIAAAEAELTRLDAAIAGEGRANAPAPVTASPQKLKSSAVVAAEMPAPLKE